MTDSNAASGRTRVRRHAERGRYDRATIESILDDGLICHVGVNIGEEPSVVPMMYARLGDRVYIHGAVANRTLRALREGAPACVVVTLLDGLVLARSAFNHSMNYRSVVIYGRTVEVLDPAEKMRAMQALVEHVAPGRWSDCRRPSPAEMQSTVILELPVAEASAKVRSGPPLDDEADLELPYWAGILPLSLVPGDPVSAPELDSAATTPPAYVTGYRRP